MGKTLPTRDVQDLTDSMLRKGMGKFAGAFLLSRDPLFTEQV